MKCLLVNPWITDFAAYNFWVRPLGLYRMAQWLDARGADFCLLDCLSPFKAPGKFRRKKIEFPGELPFDFDRSFARYGISLEEFRQRIADVGDFDAVFLTSVMSYWYPGIQLAIEEIKKISPGAPIILGGIYATLWPEHALQACQPDFLCTGPIDACSEELARFLALEPRPKREEKPWYLLPGLLDHSYYWAIRTATGCPFSCSYCASRIISGAFSPRPPEEVISEISFLHAKGIRQIAFYDDALLVDFESRLGPILKGLLAKGIRLTFHTPNGLHARLIQKDVAELLTRSNFQTIRLSLETIDPIRQADTGGKVTSKDLEQAVRNLLVAGMPSSAIGVYLLVGLPDQDLDEIEKGIRYVKGLGVRPYLAEFSPIPGTVEWRRLERRNLVSRQMDPLLTNNSLYFRLYSGYDMERFQELKRLAAS